MLLRGFLIDMCEGRQVNGTVWISTREEAKEHARDVVVQRGFARVIEETRVTGRWRRGVEIARYRWVEGKGVVEDIDRWGREIWGRTFNQSGGANNRNPLDNVQ